MSPALCPSYCRSKLKRPPETTRGKPSVEDGGAQDRAARVPKPVEGPLPPCLRLLQGPERGPLLVSHISSGLPAGQLCPNTNSEQSRPSTEGRVLGWGRVVAEGIQRGRCHRSLRAWATGAYAALGLLGLTRRPEEDVQQQAPAEPHLEGGLCFPPFSLKAEQCC